jgi:hypothetical protein
MIGFPVPMEAIKAQRRGGLSCVLTPISPPVEPTAKVLPSPLTAIASPKCAYDSGLGE